MDNAECELCLFVGEAGDPLPPCPFVPLGKSAAAVGVIFFCSIYLEIKVSNPTSGLTLGALEGGGPSPSGGRGVQRTGGEQHGRETLFAPVPRREIRFWKMLHPRFAT